MLPFRNTLAPAFLLVVPFASHAADVSDAWARSTVTGQTASSST